MFVNKLTVHDKYSLLNIVNLTQRIQIHLSQKQNIFSEYTCTILKFKLNFEHFRKKMTRIVYIFPKLRTPKYEAR